MKLHPTTLLILAMFGSFALILGTMVVIFRADPKPARQRPAKQIVTRQDTVKQPVKVASDTQITAAKPRKPETRPAPAKPNPLITSPKLVPDAASQRDYRALQREKKEMEQLRTDMEQRLKQALEDHKRKLSQLARRCEPLEPGEAVEILMTLSDDDIAVVIRQMKPDKTAPIIELLKRNGRKIK